MATRVLLVLALFSLCGATTFYRKHLAGPPSEFESNKLPSPQQAALEERSATYEIKFKPSTLGSTTSVYSIALPVDSGTLFSFSIFSPLQDNFKVILKDPSGEVVDLSTHILTGDLSSFPIGLGSIPGINYLFEAPFPKGDWILTIQTAVPVKARLDKEPDGLVILFNESPIRAHTYLTTYKLKKGGQVGLATRLVEEPEGTLQPKALRDVIVSAVMQVRDPNGDNQDVPMHDDGLHGDEESNDGIWGAFIDASQEGMYRAEAYIVGTAEDGLNMARTTQHLIPILNPHVQLTNEAFFRPKDNSHVDVVVTVNKLVPNDDNTYRAYAELWGKDKSNNDIAVCWLAGLVNVENAMGQDSISLELNLQWVKKAGAHGPFSLKNVVLQDIDVYVPIDEAAQISILDFEGVAPAFMEPEDIEITKEMKQGVFPAELLRQWASANTTAAAPSLLLVHGYCSDVNPWLKYAADFSDASFFLVKSSSLTHDKFAQLVVQHVQNTGMTKWSGIGHSQGGMVLTHVLNYYFSGLDQSSGGRKIQSVGAPYQGNSGAGSAANLIKIFGYGCGENFDLTTDGSKLWNPGITTDVRDEVYYYTTTYKQGQFFGDYCNLAVNLLLKWPNDGTCEEALSDLKGGHDLGNKQGWCHTADMKYSAQYYDSDRNKEMNSQAAR